MRRAWSFFENRLTLYFHPKAPFWGLSQQPDCTSICAGPVAVFVACKPFERTGWNDGVFVPKEAP